MTELRFTIKYTGGDTDEHKLDLYDAAKSIHGLAKALAISTHALVTDGEVRRRGDSIPNVKFFLHPPQKGSFVEVVSIIFQEPAVQAVGGSVIVTAFWEMLRYTWQIATGLQPEPARRIEKKILNENETFPQEITDALEIPLQELHRPIMHNRRVKIEIIRPRVGTVIKFDSATLDYVNSVEDAGIQTDILGNVTKYNILSGYGRFYDDNEERTIPFHLAANITDIHKEVITRSLHLSGQYLDGKILLDAHVIRDNTGRVKKYIIVSAKDVDAA